MRAFDSALSTAFLPCIFDFLHSTITSSRIAGGVSHLPLNWYSQAVEDRKAE